MATRKNKKCRDCKYFVETDFPDGLCGHPNCTGGCEVTVYNACDFYVLDPILERK